MTQVTIENKTVKTPSSEVKITEAYPGVWYVVSSYEHNQVLAGQIGVLIEVWDEAEQKHNKTLVEPRGRMFTNPDFYLKPLKDVKVIYEEHQ